MYIEVSNASSILAILPILDLKGRPVVSINDRCNGTEWEDSRKSLAALGNGIGCNISTLFPMPRSKTSLPVCSQTLQYYDVSQPSFVSIPEKKMKLKTQYKISNDSNIVLVKKRLSRSLKVKCAFTTTLKVEKYLWFVGFNTKVLDFSYRLPDRNVILSQETRNLFDDSPLKGNGSNCCAVIFWTHFVAEGTLTSYRL